MNINRKQLFILAHSIPICHIENLVRLTFLSKVQNKSTACVFYELVNCKKNALNILPRESLFKMLSNSTLTMSNEFNCTFEGNQLAL